MYHLFSSESVLILVSSANRSAALPLSDCIRVCMYLNSLHSAIRPYMAGLADLLEIQQRAVVLGVLQCAACLVGLAIWCWCKSQQRLGRTQPYGGRKYTDTAVWQNNTREECKSPCCNAKTRDFTRVHAVWQRQMSERMTMERVKNDLQTKLQRFICSLHR